LHILYILNTHVKFHTNQMLKLNLVLYDIGDSSIWMSLFSSIYFVYCAKDSRTLKKLMLLKSCTFYFKIKISLSG